MRDAGLELGNGSAVIARIPKAGGAYDLDALSELVMSLKRDNPSADQASVLLEPDIEYDYLIRVMDVVRSAEVPVADLAPDAGAPGGGEPQTGDPGDPASPRPMTRVALFTEIAVGDAP